MNLKLEILICTINEGIIGIKDMLMPQEKDISYLISWQQTEDFRNRNMLEGLNREDIRIITLDGKGLSRNRNNALNNAKGDICLIADDDVRFNRIGLERLVNTFMENPSLDLGTFKYESKKFPKSYPSESFDLRYSPRFYHCSSIEMAFRRKSIQGKIQFNELFGIGAPVLGAGEEFVFLSDALKENLNCRFFPINIVSHEVPSTAQANGGNPSVIMARGAAIRMQNPHTWPLRYIINSLRISKSTKVDFKFAFKYLKEGGEYAKNNHLL